MLSATRTDIGKDVGDDVHDTSDSDIPKTTKDPSSESALEKAEQMSPENDTSGNVEYKLKLVDPTPDRIEHLTTQMKWRLGQGGGEMFYEIGVDDSGVPRGLSSEDFEATIATLKKMASSLHADVTVLRKRQGLEGVVAEVLVRQNERGRAVETRIAAIGNVDSGKSTLLGVLGSGKRDNGRGSARMALFQHKHEMESGRTSSVGHITLCFDAKGRILNYTEESPVLASSDVYAIAGDPDVKESEKAGGDASSADDKKPPKAKTAAGDDDDDDDDDDMYALLGETPDAPNEAYADAAKIVTLLDQPGHKKYLRTTLFGMTGHSPDYAMLTIGANMGVVGTTIEHLYLTLALKLPVFVVVTKIDMCPENVMRDTIAHIKRILKSPGSKKIPFVIHNLDDVAVCAQKIRTENVTPIFCVSSVDGTNLFLLRRFLNMLPSNKNWGELAKQPLHMSIDADYAITGVGTVVSGVILSGTIKNSQQCLLGPDSLGNFKTVSFKGMRVNDVPVTSATAGQSVTVAIRGVSRQEVRHGAVIVSKDSHPVACYEFRVDLGVLYHSATIAPGFEAVVHCGNIKQTARLIEIEDGREYLRARDRGICRFRFNSSPAYMEGLTRCIFRDGSVRAVGKIVEAIPYYPPVTAGKGSRRQGKEGGGKRDGKEGSVAPEEKKEISVLRRSGDKVPTSGDVVEINGVAYTPVNEAGRQAARLYKSFHK